MKTNTIIICIVLGIVIAGGAFYGGMQYQKSQNLNNAFGNRLNGQGRIGGLQGTRPVNGEIISQNDKSITVKMQDGSSKIIILSDKTTINKATAGEKSDLKTGERVTAFGSANSDGSITAQNISIGGGMFRGIQATPSAK